EPLMRLATDKVEVDVEAEAAGLFHPAVAQGSELPPGALVGWLLEEGEAVPATSAAAPSAPTAAPHPAEPVVAASPETLTPPTQTGRQFVSPNARRVARERGVDVTQLRGTGPSGRVITADVIDALEQPAVAASAAQAQGPGVVSPLVRRDAVAAGVDLGAVPAGPGGKIRRADVIAAAARQGAAPPGLPAQVIPLTGMRGVIASRMHASLQEMAQLTLGTDATMDAAVDLRARLKEQWSAAGIAVPTITDFIVRAAALALVRHPRLNASVQEQSILVQSDINVGIAVALDDGLIVPVVKNADQLPLSSIAAETKRLAAGSRTGKLALPDLEGGTFTVSTLGSFGIDFFTPVITPGQVAILGVGRLRESVRWDGATPVRTQVLTLSLTFDHRAVDGAPAADYLRAVVDQLQNPLSLLA